MQKELLRINESYTQKSYHLIASQHYRYFPCFDQSHHNAPAHSMLACCKEVR